MTDRAGFQPWSPGSPRSPRPPQPSPQPSPAVARVARVTAVAPAARVATLSDKVLCDLAVCLALQRKDAGLRSSREKGPVKKPSMVRYCAMMAYNITVLRTRTDHAHALALRAEAAATGGGYRRAFARYIEVAKADAEDLSSVDNMHLLPLDVLLAEYMRMHGQMDGAGVDETNK